jgi:hypothetical protein
MRDNAVPESPATESERPDEIGRSTLAGRKRSMTPNIPQTPDKAKEELIQMTDSRFFKRQYPDGRFLCGLVPLVSTLLFIAAVPATAGLVAFDFDSGTPTLSDGNGLPVSQTNGGVTATFTGNFFVTTYNPAWNITGFSNLYIEPIDQNGPSSLNVGFSQQLNSLSFNYGAVDQNELAVSIVITAYQDSTANVVGSQTITAAVNNGFEMGIATISGLSGSFNLVNITTTGGGRPSVFLADGFSADVSSEAPEPASMALAGLGLTGLAVVTRRRRQIRAIKQV